MITLSSVLDNFYMLNCHQTLETMYGLCLIAVLTPLRPNCETLVSLYVFWPVKCRKGSFQKFNFLYPLCYTTNLGGRKCLEWLMNNSVVPHFPLMGFTFARGTCTLIISQSFRVLYRAAVMLSSCKQCITQPHPAFISLISSLYSVNHSDFIEKATMREADARAGGFILRSF